MRTAVTLSDGRALEAWVEGPDEGDALLFHHGTPSSGMPFDRFTAEASARGIRLVSYSRPGYGGSDRRKGRTVGDCARDVSELLDRLGIDDVITAGWSGGGPHALACAALLPDRVRSAATVAGAGPFVVDDLDFLDGMADENLEEFGAAIEGPDALRRWMETNAPPFASVTAEHIVEAFGGLVSDVDKASLTPEFAAFLAGEMRYALGNGWWGWFDDDLAFVRDWGFDLSVIRVPVMVWQGAQDMMVPFAHGEWLAANVPGVRPRLFPEHGHLSLAVESFGRIVDDLASAGGEAA